MVVYWAQTEACRIAIMPRPGGGDRLEDEIRLLKNAGVDVIVSALEQEECALLELSQEGELCRQGGVDFISFPIPDRSVPASVEEFESCIDAVDHGYSTADAFSLLEQARGFPVPDTPEQREWVERFRARTQNAGER